LVATNNLGYRGTQRTLGKIINSYANVDIKGGAWVGGLVSTNVGIIIDSYAMGTVNGNTWVGGLVGYNFGGSVEAPPSCGTIANSYSTATVNGNRSVGGLVGATSYGTIKYSYSTGHVNGAASTGGLIGDASDSPIILDSYYDLDSSGQSDTGKGTPKTTTQMMQESTFVDWDFVNIWEIKEGVNYPKSRQQQVDEVNFAHIPSPQKISTPFPIKILANKAGFNDRVYLYSVLGKVDPRYVDLVNSQWSGTITLFEIGKNNQLELRWDEEEKETSKTNVSNNFDVTDQNGQINKDATLIGNIVDDNSSLIVGVTLQIFNGDPSLGGHMLYSTATGVDGDYRFKNVFPGSYYLVIQKTGYQNTTRKIALAANRTITTDITLYHTCDAKGKVPVLLLPGIMGSYSSKTAYWVWPYPRLAAISPKWDSGELRLLDPFRLVGWHSIKESLKQQGYVEGCSIFSVPYDWSLSNPDIRDQYLIPWINRAKQLSGSNKVDIVAHSMGGLVARSYIQSKSLYNDDVRKLAIVGTPNKGADMAYYIWEGGNPIEADILAGNIGFRNPTAYFYTNTLDYLNYDRRGEHICNFGWIRRFVPTNCDSNKIYDASHSEFVSSGQLMPIFYKALINGTNADVPIIKEENSFVKALNKVPCFNPKGCIDPRGVLYNYIDPQYIFTNDSATGVQTELFIGSKEQTLNSIYVKARSPSYTGEIYKDAVPSGAVTKASGDGTVLTTSVFFDEHFPQRLKFLEKPGEHGFLISEFLPELTEFITGSSYIPVKLAIQPRTLAIAIDGKVQPDLISITGPNGDTIKLSALDKEYDFKIDGSELMIENPVDGKYTVSLNSQYNENYELSLLLYYGNNTNRLSEQKYLGYYDGSLKTFDFVVNNESFNNTIILDRTFSTPTNLVENSVGNKIQLTWQDIVGDTNKDVAYYEIYWKTETEPYMHMLAKTMQKKYLTDHDWKDAPTNTYAVRSVLKNAKSTFLSQPIFFIPDRFRVRNRLLN